LSKHDDEIIAKYLTGSYAKLVSKSADAMGGINRVEGDCIIMSNGTPFRIHPKSLHERWAEEEECRPADWLRVWSE